MGEIDAILSQETASPAAGRVRIGASPAFIRRCLVRLLPALVDRHPDILLDLRASDSFVDLAEAGLDLAIRSGVLDACPGHVGVPWFDFDWIACAAPAYLERRGAPQTPAGLDGHDLIGFATRARDWSNPGASRAAGGRAPRPGGS